jgi:hypothetical protein
MERIIGLKGLVIFVYNNNNNYEEEVDLEFALVGVDCMLVDSWAREPDSLDIFNYGVGINS